jgi:hypothetical protein
VTQTDTPWKSILVAATGAAALIDATTLRSGDVTCGFAMADGF